MINTRASLTVFLAVLVGVVTITFFFSLIAGTVALLVSVWLLYVSNIFLSESEGAIIIYMGRFYGSIINWKGHVQGKSGHIYAEGKDYVLKGDPPDGMMVLKGRYLYKDGLKKIKVLPERPKAMGGLIFLFRPFFYPFFHDASLTAGHKRKGDSVKGADGKKSWKFCLRPQQYESEVVAATNSRTGYVEVVFKYLIEIRIINMYNYAFISPDASIDNFITRIDAWFERELLPFLSFYAAYSICTADVMWNGIDERHHLWTDYSFFMKSEGFDPKPLKGLKDHRLITEVAPQYGLKVSKQTIVMFDLVPTDNSMKEALTEPRKREVLAEAHVKEKKGERDGEVEMMSVIEDTKIMLLRAGFPETEARERAYEIYRESLAGTRGQLIRWPDGGTLEKGIASAVFSAGLINGSGGKGGGEKSSSKEEEGFSQKEKREFQKGVADRL